MNSTDDLSINWRKMLKSIIYVCCSKVSGNENRAIERIEIILHLLKSEESQFFMILLRNISR